MKTNELKIVAPVLAIAEDHKYSQYTVSVQCNSAPDNMFKVNVREVAHLWQVVLKKDNSIHYCLAESAEGAIGQCTCSGMRPENRSDATAIQLPFRVRGWGSQAF